MRDIGIDLFFEWFLQESAAIVRSIYSFKTSGRVRAGPDGLTAVSSSQEVLSKNLGSTDPSTFRIRSNHSLDLVFDGTGLERKISPIRLPLQHLRKAALFDLGSNTPLSAEDVALFHYRGEAGSDGSWYAAVKMGNVYSTLAHVKKANLRVSRILYRGKNAEFRLFDDTEAVLLGGKKSPWLGNALQVTMLIFLITGVSTFVHLNYRAQGAIKIIEAQEAALHAEVTDLRRVELRKTEKLLRIGRLRDERSKQPTISVILEELTRVIPDSAWVADLKVSAGEIRVVGFARSASSLVAGIDASPLFSNPQIQGQVVRDARTLKERFTIRIGLEES